MYKYKKNKVIFEIERRFVWASEIRHAVLHLKFLCYFINEHNYVSKIKSEYEKKELNQIKQLIKKYHKFISE